MTEHAAENAGTQASAPHPSAERNRGALENIIAEIRGEYADGMTVFLDMVAYDNSLNLYALEHHTAGSFGLGDTESIWQCCKDVDTTDPAWHQGVAEMVTLDNGATGWRIDVDAAARILG